MPTLNPYLNFNGSTEEAFSMYKSVFGGEFTYLQRYRDIPDGDNLSEELKDKIMHISLPVGNSILMATDALEEMGQKLVVGNNHYVSVSVDSREEADRIFNGLSENATIEMPMEDMFWGDYFGSLIDRYGIGWMISYTIPK